MRSEFDGRSEGYPLGRVVQDEEALCLESPRFYVLKETRMGLGGEKHH
jgi:hypothetical protein